jgi:ribose transport system substrate-binding protein
MKRLVMICAAAAVLAGAARAEEHYRFAVVPKAMNNPFFDLARDGCLKRAKELGKVDCIYKGPIEHEPATQVQIIQDLITQGIDGIAISVSDVGVATGVIKAARAAGLVVITFDADAPGSVRQAYVGTDNKEMGRELGRQLLKAQADAGHVRHPIRRSGGRQSERALGRSARDRRQSGLEGRTGLADLLQR